MQGDLEVTPVQFKGLVTLTLIIKILFILAISVLAAKRYSLFVSKFFSLDL